MQNHPIHWSEGLFLRPQHLQSADRYWEELLGTSSRFDAAFQYGLFRLDLNQSALDSQLLEITRCEARLKQGTIVSFDTARIDRIDLNDRVASDSKFEAFLRENLGIRVFLAVPQLRLGRRNVSHQPESTVRFIELPAEFEDESTGGNPQEVPLKDLNVQIMFESDDLAGFETIPIARLHRSSEMNGNLSIDPYYYPPCLTTRSWPSLDRDIMKELHDQLNQRSEFLRRHITERGINFSSQIAGALDRLMLLQSINQGLGTLNCLSFSEGVHPFVAYTALCEMVGRLSVFGADKSNGEMPRYDHEDLHTIFRWALDRIGALIDLGDEGYIQRFFKGDGGPRLRVALDTDWFTSRWRLFLGIHSIEMPATECLRLLDSTVTWKIASADEVDFCFEKHARSLKLSLLKQAPPALPTQSGWTYFEMREDDRWQSVRQSASLAIRVNKEQILNFSDLENNQTVILDAAGQRLPIELAVFAVRTKS
jgi:type VI secretion system protein ImpJ